MLPLLVIAVLVSTSSLVSAQSSNSAREQAITNLSRLVDTYDVSLTASERRNVQTICRDLQVATIQTLSTQLEPQREKYSLAMQSTDSTIKFTANALFEMSEDSSDLDLAGVHLQAIEQEFERASAAYARSLDELLVIDCQLFPEQFVAGLEEARFRRQLMVAAAEKVTEFRDTELKTVFDSLLKRLEEFEARR